MQGQMFLLTQENREQRPVVCSDNNRTQEQYLPAAAINPVCACSSHPWWNPITTAVCIRPSERNWKTPQRFLTKSAAGELQGNLTCRLSFRQHFGNSVIQNVPPFLSGCALAFLFCPVAYLDKCENHVWKTESDLPTFKIRVPQTEM
jgi:hypothetical protein